MKGFTLIEILVALLILSFMLVGIYTVLNYGYSTYSNELGLLDLQQQARRAMDGMIREIRQTNESAGQGNLSIPSASTIIFNIPPDTFGLAWIGPITYYLDTVEGRIVREYPAGTLHPVAGDISGLIFSQSGDIINIEFTCAKTVNRRDLSITVKGQVRLRNE